MIVCEVTLKARKWAIICAYKPPSTVDQTFFDSLSSTLDKCLISYEHALIFGDLNCDLACQEKGRSLVDFMEVFSLENLSSKPTCFKKDCIPSLVDVILTNAKKSYF